MLFAGFVVLLALGLLWLGRPLAPRDLRPHASPAAGYEESLRLLDSLVAADTDSVAFECRSALRTHGARTGRAVLLFHGLTNCPAQCDSLAGFLFAQGANVFVPRLPQHGYANRMTEALALSDAREYAGFTDRAVDIAAGLGDTLIVMGLSTGGVMAAWAAQERPEVGRAIPVAPLLATPQVPGLLLPALTRLAVVVPNVYVWWDPKQKQDLAGPKHVYPRFGSRAAAATLLLGAAVRQSAALRPPACRTITVVMVGGDPAVDNGAVLDLARAWRAHGTADVTTYTFPESLHLNHDVVDPEQVGGNPVATYPVLLKAMGFSAKSQSEIGRGDLPQSASTMRRVSSTPGASKRAK